MLLGTFLLRHLGLRKHISQLLVPAFKLLEKKLVSAHEPSHPELSPAPSLVLCGFSFQTFRFRWASVLQTTTTRWSRPVGAFLLQL